MYKVFIKFQIFKVFSGFRIGSDNDFIEGKAFNKLLKIASLLGHFNVWGSSSIDYQDLLWVDSRLVFQSVAHLPVGRSSAHWYNRNQYGLLVVPGRSATSCRRFPVSQLHTSAKWRQQHSICIHSSKHTLAVRSLSAWWPGLGLLEVCWMTITNDPMCPYFQHVSLLMVVVLVTLLAETPLTWYCIRHC